jgi:hypothetical protein
MMPEEKVFVYRTKLNFVGVCIPTFFTFLFLLASSQETIRRWWPDWDAHFVRNTPTELAVSSTIGAVMALLSLWLWQRFFYGKVVINDETIRQYGTFDIRSVKWEEIQAVTMSKHVAPFYVYKIHGPSSRLYIWTGISNVLKLESEINGRIPATISKLRYHTH